MVTAPGPTCLLPRGLSKAGVLHSAGEGFVLANAQG